MCVWDFTRMLLCTIPEVCMGSRVPLSLGYLGHTYVALCSGRVRLCMCWEELCICVTGSKGVCVTGAVCVWS